MLLKGGSSIRPFVGNTSSNSLKSFLISGDKTLHSEEVVVHLSVPLQRRSYGGWSVKITAFIDL